MIYIFAEKKYLARVFAELLITDDNVCTFTLGASKIWEMTDYSSLWIKIPRLTYDKIPYTEQAKTVFKDNNNLSFYTKDFNNINSSIYDFVPSNINGLFNNNEVVYLGDSDGDAILNFMEVVKLLGKPTHISYAFINSMGDNHIIEQFKNRKPFDYNLSQYKISLINRRFDILYYLNGLVLFSKFNLGFHPTKEHIQLLYLVKYKYFKNPEYYTKNGKTISYAPSIKGTGKYPIVYIPITENNKELHSGYISWLMSGLIDNGMIENYTTLSLKGENFLNSLHPDCYDPDIFGRIIEWSALGYSVAEDKVKSYIKRYFSRQKRFL